MNLKNLKTEQIKDYIQTEYEKGRSIREVVKEVAEARNDFTVLSTNSEISREQIFKALGKTQV